MVPPDDGFGTPGNGELNTPSLVEAADTGPFFHNNSVETVETIEGAMAFYNGDAFNNSPAGQLIIGATGSGINLDGTQVVEVAAFLRVINTLENIRQSIELLQSSMSDSVMKQGRSQEMLEVAVAETKDSILVLIGGGLHPEAVQHLKAAKKLTKKAVRSHGYDHDLAQEAIQELKRARSFLIETV